MFDEKYFRVTKIGELVCSTIKYLAENNKLGNDDIFNLKDREFSSSLCYWLPIIVTNKSETRDNSGRSRYYQNKIIINNGSENFLCKEWREEYRQKFVPWAKNMLAK